MSVASIKLHKSLYHASEIDKAMKRVSELNERELIFTRHREGDYFVVSLSLGELSDAEELLSTLADVALLDSAS